MVALLLLMLDVHLFLAVGRHQFPLHFTVSDAEHQRLFTGPDATDATDARRRSRRLRRREHDDVIVHDVIAVDLDDQLLGDVLAALQPFVHLVRVRLPPVAGGRRQGAADQAAGPVAHPRPRVPQVAVALPVAAVERAVRYPQ